MLTFFRNTQTLTSLAIIAISFFIQYGFFITHFRYTNELYIIFSILILSVSALLFTLKIQPLVLIKQNTNNIQLSEKINNKGSSRLMLYDLMSLLFKLSLLIISIKFFGVFHHQPLAFLIMIILDILFTLIYRNTFSNVWINNTLILFNSRSELVSFQNVKKIEVRYDDFYITYKNGTVKLLKSDMISEELRNKISAFS